MVNDARKAATEVKTKIITAATSREDADKRSMAAKTRATTEADNRAEDARRITVVEIRDMEVEGICLRVESMCQFLILIWYLAGRDANLQ